jgi:hypothetical protein
MVPTWDTPRWYPFHNIILLSPVFPLQAAPIAPLPALCQDPVAGNTCCSLRAGPNLFKSPKFHFLQSSFPVKEVDTPLWMTGFLITTKHLFPENQEDIRSKIGFRFGLALSLGSEDYSRGNSFHDTTATATE